MKKIKIYTGAILLVVICASCSRQLDVKPSSSLEVPSSAADFQALMDNTSKISQVWPYAGIAGGDEGFVTTDTWLAARVTERNAYVWDRNVFNDLDRNDWSLPYSVVYYANVVLEGAAKYGTAGDDWNNIRGQASFLRGYAYYQLAQEFCKVYEQGTAATDAGLVLRESSDLNVKSVRSTVAQTYARMIADLSAAVPLLPVVALVKTRPCRAAAYAMLARTYLCMGVYDKAGLYADSSLRLNGTLIDYNKVNPGTGVPFARFNDEVLFHTTSFPTAMLLPLKLMVDSNLYVLYEVGDLRKTLFFKPQPGTNWFTFNGSYDGTVILFNGPATDEMYLVRAEAEARGGNMTAALADLNTLRKNRYATAAYQVLSTGDQVTTLSWVLLERRRQLLFRGLRWTDLRRLNKEPALAKTLRKIVGGQLYELPPGDARYVWPIPQQVIGDTGMAQN
ncbi:RagB/SusD family nutrient uptake outer membrane protein [Mucilaginibacter sp. FT3.2]|uniref:RagB/SusD family nutrient uptake outer membrane protein n=1 Tax=Mucilaginibacter sp. FT3.2 TaxID=2723090 RepID=UPI00160890E8|nr:RagB/SusD family nutrient uptake outer membrane protein [Mucilaginibacter sp. FT3.2]MBB6234201.1 tetratricopeptide (TPR) repeat protein [Mucilaginibacter sp. FT3.2]